VYWYYLLIYAVCRCSADAGTLRNRAASSDAGLCGRNARRWTVHGRTSRTHRLGSPLALGAVSASTAHTGDQRSNSALLRYEDHGRRTSQRYVILIWAYPRGYIKGFIPPQNVVHCTLNGQHSKCDNWLNIYTIKTRKMSVTEVGVVGWVWSTHA